VLVVAVEVDGVEEQALVALEGELPIYAQWNAQSDKLAVLAQDQDELVLWTCRLGVIGERRPVDQGVPLFFSWAPTGDRILVHVGRRATHAGRVILRDPEGTDEDHLMAPVPGAFCTPLFVDGLAVYVVAVSEGRSTICVEDLDVPPAPRILATFEGLIAMVPRPGHSELAVGAAAIGDASPYQGVVLLPVDGSAGRTLLDEPCLAFFFDPKGERLLYVKAGARGQGVTIHRLDVDSAERHLLGRFWPSPDQLYYLQFFEQFCQSHPLVAPDGRTLLFSGYEDPSLQGRDASPRIFAVDLLDEAPLPRVVGEGSFAVFSRS
jgi:hypothetical protein